MTNVNEIRKEGYSGADIYEFRITRRSRRGKSEDRLRDYPRKPAVLSAEGWIFRFA
jgi:hypothetical protein